MVIFHGYVSLPVGKHSRIKVAIVGRLKKRDTTLDVRMVTFGHEIGKSGSEVSAQRFKPSGLAINGH